MSKQSRVVKMTVNIETAKGKTFRGVEEFTPGRIP
jgi:hypothetical protein